MRAGIFARSFIGVLVSGIAALGGAQKCAAETISFDSVLNDAVLASFDLKLTRVRAQELRCDIKAARAEYYPTLLASASSEYDKGLTNSQQQIFAVANSTFNAVTRFQELAALQSYWTLFDFGARFNTWRAAKRAYESATTASTVAVRDLKVNIIDLYSQTLTVYKTLKAKEQAVPIYKELFALKNNTYAAGTITRMELGEQSLQLAQAEDNVRELRELLVEKLKQLAAYTHKVYDIDRLAMLDFDEPNVMQLPAFVAKATPDYQQYQKQIESKRAELRALQAQRMPQVKGYGGYVFYGTNANNFGNAVNNFGQRLLNVGVTVSWTAFDGFKNQAQCQRKRYEIAELEVQRDKRLWDLQNQYETASTTLAPLAAELSTKAEVGFPLLHGQ